MIVVQGTVRGKVDAITFEPTKPRFKRNGQIVLNEPQHALLKPNQGDTEFRVELADNVELPGRWSWLCYERSGKRTRMFSFPADPATHDYATLRGTR